jgi:hypothetical protein
MPQLSRFSLSYDAPEDRIAWDAEDVGGAVTRLWLTQRLCRDFVAALVPRLPKPAAAAAPEHEAAIQSWEQAAAMASFGSTPGVSFPAEAAAGLVRTVHIAPTPDKVTLVFETAVGEPAAITLDGAALRQMLAVLFALHRAAAWPTDFWPDWIAAQPATAEGAPALN